MAHRGRPNPSGDRKKRRGGYTNERGGGRGTARTSRSRVRSKPRGSDAARLGVSRRLQFVLALMVALAVLPVYKLLGVVLSDGDSLVASGKAQGFSEQPIAALRGPILDRNGSELAISLPRVRMAANARELGELSKDEQGAEGRFVEILARTTSATEDELMGLLDEAEPDDPWVELIPQATDEEVDAARDALLEAGLLDALVLEQTSVRDHPSGESGLRLIGTLGADGPGPGAGVERALDEQLRGIPGTRTVELSPNGEVIAGSESVIDKPADGSSVFLTIDRNLNYEVEQVLLTGVERTGAAGGVAIVGRPDTGELLAVAGVERDPDTGEVALADSPKAFADAYQAGSVFKLVPVSAAIDQGLVQLDTALSVPQSITLYDRTFTDHDPHPTKAMSVRDIVAHSSNVGTIKIAEMVGKESLYSELREFGFGETTGVEAPAESSGILPPVELWNGPDIGASAIGTLQSATALQLWSAYNVIANDGTYVAPRLVKKVVGADGATTGDEPAPRRPVIAPDAAAQVEQALMAVVTEGTGKNVAIPGFPAAAKTGTSRMPSPERVDGEDGYMWSDGRYHYLNAFTGYLPVDAPQLSITVLLEDVDGGLTGSTGAGPVFAELARLGIRELGIAPSRVGGTDSGGDGAVSGLRAEPASAGSQRALSPAGRNPDSEVEVGSDGGADAQQDAQQDDVGAGADGSSNGDDPDTLDG
ncbi:MAG: peptidoglycan D,D-transpeptidase FtsI family protein [Microthrixaceae bacterium]